MGQNTTVYHIEKIDLNIMQFKPEVLNMLLVHVLSVSLALQSSNHCQDLTLYKQRSPG